MYFVNNWEMTKVHIINILTVNTLSDHNDLNKFQILSTSLNKFRIFLALYFSYIHLFLT